MITRGRWMFGGFVRCIIRVIMRIGDVRGPSHNLGAVVGARLAGPFGR